MDVAQFRLNSTIEMEHWWFVARRQILHDMVARLVPAGQDRVIVDVGCGTGGNIASLNDDYTCVGIDPSAEAIELARSRFPRVKFLQGWAPDDLVHGCQEADLFLLCDVLEHVSDDKGVFSKLVRAASAGSHFVITVPADMSLWSPHDVSHGHFRRYDARQLMALWEELPVSQLALSYFNSRLYWPVRVVRTVNRWRGKASGKDDTDLKLPPHRLNRWLQALFAGESRRLQAVYTGQGRPYRRGVSLLAILRRES